MDAVKFSKKQLKPIMDKYQIDENNEYFRAIISLFPEQTNYHIWAIKAVFDKNATVTTIKEIKEWADANQPMIQHLSKGNIVLYKSKEDFSRLKTEIRGLVMYQVVNTAINNFNTTQKKMLRDALLPNTETTIDAYNLGRSPMLKTWYETFTKFNRLPITRKKKFWSSSSAVYDLSTLKQLIIDCLAQSYEWNKEDLLQFVANNTPDCEVVWNEGDIVILDVPSFTSSKKLCGSGRTGWCLTREDNYFRRYVTNVQGNHQYFFFDFSKKEKDELAHIGFTVNPTNGITNAHSTGNSDLLSGISYNGRTVKVQDALRMANVSPMAYIRLNKLTSFKWDIISIMDMINDNTDKFSLSIQKGNVLVIRILTNEGFERFASYSRIPLNTFNLKYDGTALYIIVNLDKGYTDKDSMLTVNIVKDEYGVGTVRTMLNPYGEAITESGYIEKMFGIKVSDFYQREKIDPKIMLHKLIMEGSEEEAIELLENNADVDVNFEFNYNAPIMLAIEKTMLKLFNIIINHPKFDSEVMDGFGSTILTKLMYDCYDDSYTEKQHNNVVAMIRMCLDSGKFDLNKQDLNEDSVVNIAANSPMCFDFFNELVHNPEVDINIVNDFNCSALGQAIRVQNIEAIKLLAQRPDFKIREEDNILAENFKVDLKSIVSSVTERIDFSERKKEVDTELANVLSKVFSGRRK